MGYIIKGLAILSVIILYILDSAIEPLVVMGLLLIMALWIYREKYASLPLLMVVEYIVIIFLSFLNPISMLMCSVLAYDLMRLGLYWFPALLFPGGFFFFSGQLLAFFSVLLILSTLSGYLNYRLIQKEKSFQEIYDRERRSRYSLEEARAKLMNSAREEVHLAEARERNRIARDIHDHIGHNLAGILLQLQVMKKVQAKDPEQAQKLLAQSINGLAEAVEIMRDTVHNIKPKEVMNLDYIKKIIANFKYCQVDFKHYGDILSLSADYTGIISSILKEALTNINRHSNATLVKIELDIREKIVRLHITDNGQGCDSVREGMGISGMKERVHNAGGSLTINAKDGFSIVCVLPRAENKGGRVLESARG